MKFVKILFPLVCAILLFWLFCIAEVPKVVGFLTIPGIMVVAAIIYDSSIVSYMMFAVLLLGLIYCLLLIPFFVAYHIHSLLVFLLVSVFLNCFIVTFLTIWILKLGKYFRLMIIMRKSTILSLLLLFGTLSTVVGIGMFIADFPFWIRISCVAALFAHIVLMWRFIKEASRNLYVFSNGLKPNFILYLRRFSFDDTPEDILALKTITANKYSLRVMKIGDPSKFWKLWTDYSCIYLQSSNWQTMLHKYIEFARLVFIQVEMSDGVIWEIFNNIEFREKYIYHVTQIDSLNKIIDVVHNKVEDSSFKKIFEQFLIFVFKTHKSSTKEVTFIIDNNRILFSKEINPILNYMVTKIMSDNILSYTIQV